MRRGQAHPPPAAFAFPPPLARVGAACRSARGRPRSRPSPSQRSRLRGNALCAVKGSILLDDWHSIMSDGDAGKGKGKDPMPPPPPRPPALPEPPTVANLPPTQQHHDGGHSRASDDGSDHRSAKGGSVAGDSASDAGSTNTMATSMSAGTMASGASTAFFSQQVRAKSDVHCHDSI